MTTNKSHDFQQNLDSKDAASDSMFVPESVVVALVFGASCWLLDAFLTITLSGLSVQSAMIPSGEALALRSAVALLVAVAAAITSSFLIREIRMRREELQEEPASMHEVLESFSGSAFAVNERGEIVDANDAAGQLFQWPVNMFMPMKLDWLISEFVDDRYGHIATFSQLLETDAFRARRGSIEMIGKTLTGRKFVAELSCMPARNDESRVIVFIRERIGVAYEEERPVVSASAI